MSFSKGVAFSIRWMWPYDAMSNSFLDSKSSILGLSNEVSFVPEILWKDG